MRWWISCRWIDHAKGREGSGGGTTSRARVQERTAVYKQDARERVVIIG
jgi:hypothetical protein